MNKGLMIGIAALVIIGAGAGSYYVISNNSGNDAASTSNTTSTSSNDSMLEESDDNSVNGTFSELLKLGQNYTCTFDHTDDAGNQTEGTVYVAASGDRLRGDFTVTQNDGASYDAGVIREGDYSYVWSSEFGGFKTKISETDPGIFASSETSANTGGLNDDEDVDFDCRRWTVDASMFVPPSNINFTDTEQAMEAIRDDVMESGNIDCSVCDNIPAGPSKDQCLAALGC